MVPPAAGAGQLTGLEDASPAWVQLPRAAASVPRPTPVQERPQSAAVWGSSLLSFQPMPERRGNPKGFRLMYLMGPVRLEAPQSHCAWLTNLEATWDPPTPVTLHSSGSHCAPKPKGKLQRASGLDHGDTSPGCLSASVA